MTGIDILTRDTASGRNGTFFVTYAHAKWGDDYPISGDALAAIRVELAQEAELAQEN